MHHMHLSIPAEGSNVLKEVNMTAISEDECYKRFTDEYPDLEQSPIFVDGFNKEEKICVVPKKENHRGAEVRHHKGIAWGSTACVAHASPLPSHVFHHY